MRVLFDTNILLDILEQRAPHFQSSRDALVTCEACGGEILLAWHSLSNAFYIYGRKVGQAMAQTALGDAILCMTVGTVGHREARRALDLGFADLEDAMQAAAAEAANADWIITRDKAGFARSPVPVMTPAEFVLRFASGPPA